MTPADFSFLQDFLKRRSGLDLSDDKQYLIDSRLNPVARRHDLAGLDALVSELRAGTNRALEKAVVEAMTTNESFFFRDKTPFDQFRERIVPDLVSARASTRKLRIWCAAASSGQEPYSLAMLIKEMAGQLANWRTEIVGTDLSSEVLEKARSGLYSQFEVQRGLPVQLLVKYFEQQGDMWQINPTIRAMVEYKVLNLLESFSGLGMFDVVFCRNVLIYFDPPTKLDVLNRISKVLAPDGYLVLGAAETVVGLSTDFVPMQGGRGVYRLSPEAAESGKPAKQVVGAAPVRPSSFMASGNAAPAGTGSANVAPAKLSATATGARASNVLPLTPSRFK